jgi:hypothetical protein
LCCHEDLWNHFAKLSHKTENYGMTRVGVTGPKNQMVIGLGRMTRHSYKARIG